jgi:phosphatidylglycerophosphate synthase
MTLTEIRQKCKRDSDYIITLFFTNEVSLLLTKGLLLTAVTPNQVTIASVFCGCLSGICYACGSFFPGSLFLFCSHMLDCTDGNLARAKELFSPAGRWLDFTGNRVTEVCVFLGVAFHFSKLPDTDLWMVLTLIDAVLLLLYLYIVDIGLSLGISEKKQTITSLTYRGVRVKWGVFEPVLYGFVLLSPIGWIKVHLVFVLVIVLFGLLYQVYKNVR